MQNFICFLYEKSTGTGEKSQQIRSADFQCVEKGSVGATIGRPQILQSKICSPSGEKWLISLREIRKSKIFGGRAMLAPTVSAQNQVL